MELNALDRILLAVAPKLALERVRARAATLALARHYEAAAPGRRTAGWTRSAADAQATDAPAIATLRALARDAVRNNGYAERALEDIVNDTVGWGIIPRAQGPYAEVANAAWKKWADSTDCDADGKLTFYGIQQLVLRCMAESGEVLVRRRWRRATDGLPLPMQLQVLEPDFLDTSRDLQMGQQGGPIKGGVEFDAIGRRVAYWLFHEHPGSSLMSGFGASKRVSASEVLHVYRVKRAGQVRGPSWFGTSLLRMNDYDDYDDAQMMRQKVAACFAAFVTDPEGTAATLGVEDSQTVTNSDGTTSTQRLGLLEPGMIKYLNPGESVEFGTPPVPMDGDFAKRTLRRIAVSLGVTYEQLTGDLTGVNYSSARIGRLAHQANVQTWRWITLIPQFCDPAWRWAMEAAVIAGFVPEVPSATWTPPPVQMIEPDKEGQAATRAVRGGLMTPSEMVREQGGDPEEHWRQMADDFQKLDELGIVLDCDPRRTTQAGLLQVTPGAKAGPPAKGTDSGGK